MMAVAHAQSAFEALAGLVMFASFMTAVFCIATLRLYLDHEKMGKDETVVAILLTPFPPASRLTPKGRRRARTAKLALTLLGLTIMAFLVQGMASR